MKKQTIQVLGSSCPKCKQLFKTVEKIVAELKIEAEVEYVTDVTEMIKMGVMTSPVLAIDGKPVLTGKAHSEEEIKNALTNDSPGEKDCGECCSCCCKC